MAREPRKRGFTLVEMLVVIAIIVVLLAIIVPVFARVRAKARETQCISRLHDLALALKLYRQDHGRYPPPPSYDAGLGKYVGGFSALYPDYIDDTTTFICPDDAAVKGLGAQTQQNLYCSYNGTAVNPRGGDWTLSEVRYNYYGYDFQVNGSVVTSTGVDNGGGVDTQYFQVLMLEYQPKGLRKRAAPRLVNRSAPDNTIITHCVHHRGRGGPENQKEFVARLGGDVDHSAKRSALEEDPDGAGNRISPYIAQLN